MNEEFVQRLKCIEDVLEEGLPPSSNYDWFSRSFGCVPDGVLHDHANPSLQACRDLFLRGGKRWRPLLMVLSAELENKCAETCYQLAQLLEFTHTASLIHDDIEDHSQKRRGEDCVHIKYGIDVALNAGAWLYFNGLSVLNGFDCTDAHKVVLYNYTISIISKLHLGQTMDIEWHRKNDYIPTLEEYTGMISMKTGSLSNFAGFLGVFSETWNVDKAVRLGNILQKLGVAFQVTDDIKNITEGIAGKDLGDDIVEGKKSLPVILHLEENPHDFDKISQFFATASREGINSDAVSACIQLLMSGNTITRSKEFVNKYLNDVECEIINIYGKTEEVMRLVRFIHILASV